MHGTLPKLNTAPALTKSIVTLVDGDCLTLMKEIGDETIDLLMLDLPYCTTKMSWDKSIDPAALWAEFRRVLTTTGTIVAFGSQPFTTDMMIAGREMFKYSLVWEKSRPTGHVNANLRVMKEHEDILVFSKGTAANNSPPVRRMTYNPQNLLEAGTKTYRDHGNYMGGRAQSLRLIGQTYQSKTNYPRSILRFPKDGNLHTTQKPVALLEYLIRTFSNEGDIVCDPTMGSGSTGVACVRTGRHFIGFEKMPKYFDISVERIGQSQGCNPEPDVHTAGGAK